MKHSLGLMSVIVVYGLTEVCETDENNMLYAKLDFILGWRAFPQDTPDTPIVLCDFGASADTERVGYELCVGP